jgi:hypothetical protein
MRNRIAKKIAKRSVFVPFSNTSMPLVLSCGKGKWDKNRKIHKNVIALDIGGA